MLKAGLPWTEILSSETVKVLISKEVKENWNFNSSDLLVSKAEGKISEQCHLHNEFFGEWIMQTVIVSDKMRGNYEGGLETT